MLDIDQLKVDIVLVDQRVLLNSSYFSQNFLIELNTYAEFFLTWKIFFLDKTCSIYLFCFSLSCYLSFNSSYDVLFSPCSTGKVYRVFRGTSASKLLLPYGQKFFSQLSIIIISCFIMNKFDYDFYLQNYYSLPISFVMRRFH